MEKVYNKSGLFLLACLGVFIVFALRLSAVTSDVKQAVLDGHWFEMVQSVDLISGQVDVFLELDQNWYSYDYERDVRILAELLDQRPGVYCELFDESGGALSNHYGHDTMALPFENEMFVAAIAHHSRGEVPIEVYSLSDGKFKPAHCYFRWLPVGSYEGKLLIVVAISDEVLSADPTARLVSWCTGMLIAAGLTMVISGVLLMIRPRPKGAVDGA